MENKLSFKMVHKSIVSLSDTSLPELVVLTGRNGSGKTHLLEAINEGKIQSSLVTNHQTDVLLFDWNSIIPKDTGIFHPSQHQTQRSNWFQQIRTHQENSFKQVQQQAIALGIPAKHCTSMRKVRSLDKEKLEVILGDPQKAQSIHTNLQQHLQNQARNIFSQTQRSIGDEVWKKAAPKVLNENPELFFETSESKFFNNNKLLWGEVDAFQQAFGRLFSTYRELIHQNDRLEKYPANDEGGLIFLSQNDFIEKYGEPPWDFVNRILEVCNLEFRVEPPPMHEVSSYEPKLTKLSNDIEMRFKDLSSGEKVLMSFALCLYNASDDRQEKHFPKLLLLDEVDAPLHPSMVVSLIKTIQEVLVEGKGVSVILTTHSPSTVALAPEESLFEMNPSGPSIEKITRSRALSILTAGVPTLSVSFDGRRQVFVESKTDAYIYEKLYQAYKQYLDTERSLTFIEVGITNPNGVEQNSGCAQVERLVNTLTENGNSSVFGLIDWDGERTPTDRVFILSPNVRDGIESLLLDPVLLAATIIKENHQFCVDHKIIEKDDRYTDIGGWSRAKWQCVTDAIQKAVLDGKSEKISLEITYLNKMVLKISADYLHLDDHALEERVTTVFGFLRPKNNNAGGLMRHIITSVLGDYPDLLPNDLVITFKELLDARI
ncbi:AAA domain-containing protein, putative AbiEii toxin, Type IV TA system [Ferrimonas sediminum]|uniref:AAA domain-containing protein, putative AbiEii toxin, Type IV TA system n=1 Tax=Ferrimonas sediminum TaxID=718193 RepID=A0A1G8W4Q0_9GAMM|nr:AAA family ATPase [Ferrimonas sediminum]SDJ73278.1 AAA domain-containing protein, putative AbiEii toxin, Type IV TA system [Ferrimonas sediminum]